MVGFGAVAAVATLAELRSIPKISMTAAKISAERTTAYDTA